MDYSNEIRKLQNQLRYWRLMKILGGVIGGILFVLAVVLETSGTLNADEDMFLLGYVVSFLASFPIEVLFAGIILTFIWKRKIIARQIKMSQNRNDEYRDYHDYSIPKEDKVADDPLADFTNKDDPFH
ncbi:MAG: hypothetical protein MJ238_03045 [Bacilli bacterium]|nr:hypothetical protein [Bacilli bacterium]